MIPIWIKIREKYYPLTHFADGEIGFTMEEAIKMKLNRGIGRGMGKLDNREFRYSGWIENRFVLRKET